MLTVATPPTFDSLMDDVLQFNIFQQVNSDDRVRLILVSRRFYRLLQTCFSSIPATLATAPFLSYVNPRWVTTLDLARNECVFDDMLAPFVNLRSLDLSCNHIVGDIGLYTLTTLTQLVMPYCDSISTQSLTCLVNLRTLDIHCTPHIKYAELTGLSKLTYLRSGNSRDMYKLSSFPGLVTFDGCLLEPTTDDLGMMVSLTTLSLGHTLDEDSIMCLACIPHLVDFALDGHISLSTISQFPMLVNCCAVSIDAYIPSGEDYVVRPSLTTLRRIRSLLFLSDTWDARGILTFSNLERLVIGDVASRTTFAQLLVNWEVSPTFELCDK